MALQLQCNLDSASGSVFQVARGILQAATSDNVQPLTIMACERFGATLVMCETTRWKIEHLVAVTLEPGVIGFLRATVGFSVNDCASFLSRSLAGVQFLALAASLVTTMGPFEAANTISGMLQNSVVDKTLAPTRKQVKDLLTSLEARCQASGFANTVAGWQILLCRLPDLSTAQRDVLLVCLQHPSAADIAKLIDVMRDLHRIGPASTLRLTVRSSLSTPWTIAFIQWCLGVPPTVVMGCGRTVVQQDNSLVTVIIPATYERSLKFTHAGSIELCLELASAAT